MSKINLNVLAREITLKEGKKKNLSIADVKEVMKIIFTRLAKLNKEDIEDILWRYR